STLLNDVYKQLGTARTGQTQAVPTIVSFPVVNPNALLIVAPAADMENVLALAKQLDAPVDPMTQFQIFPLRNAVAAQIARSVTDFFKEPQGLGIRVTAFADVRTNSVIVQAQPSDLAQV